MAKRLPPGIRAKRNKLEIRIYGNGGVIHQETLDLDPTNPLHLKRAVKYHAEVQMRLRLGLPLEDDQIPAHLQFFPLMAAEYIKTHTGKDSTITSYIQILEKYWIPLFKNSPCSAITTREIKLALSDIPVSGKTRDNILGVLRGVLNHAEISPNPAAVIKTKKRQSKPIERYRPDERDRILACMTGASYVYFALFFGCGFRPGEMMGLLRNDFDGENWHVHQQIVRGKIVRSTKTGQRRKVYVPMWVRKAMKEMPTRIDSPYFFVNEDGGFFKDTRVFARAWTAAHERKQIRYRVPYTCRHTRAAELLSKGALPAQAAKQLGHSVQVFYNTYSEMIDEYSGDKDYTPFEPLPHTEHHRK